MSTPESKRIVWWERGIAQDATSFTKSSLKQRSHSLANVQPVAASSTRQPRPKTAVPTRDPRQPLTVQKTRQTGQSTTVQQPAPSAPGFFRRVTATFVRSPGPVIGATPIAVIREAKDVYQHNYFKHHPFRDEMMIQGSEGEVYIILNINNAETFAVKHTKMMPWSTPTDMPSEAKILLQQLHGHERIIAVYESIPDLKWGNEGRHRIYMEHCNAGSLFDQYRHWISRLKMPMPEVFLLHVLVQGMEALAYIHHGLRFAGKGTFTRDNYHRAIIHGDLKEHNILLTWTFQPLPQLKLADFGAARLAGSIDGRILRGTACYHAPEDVAIYGDLKPCAANGRVWQEMVNRRTIASDIYAFGLMIHMFACGELRPMKIGTDPSTLRIRKEYGTPGLLALLQKMLAVDPADRAVASFDGEHGVMGQINEMRDARDRLISARQLPGPAEWAFRAPKGHHAS